MIQFNLTTFEIDGRSVCWVRICQLDHTAFVLCLQTEICYYTTHSVILRKYTIGNRQRDALEHLPSTLLLLHLLLFICHPEQSCVIAFMPMAISTTDSS